MPNNTRARHLEIQTAARAAIDNAGGPAAIDALPEPTRHTAMLALYRQVQNETTCEYSTAKRNVNRALGIVDEPRNTWGGNHGGPVGRPRKEKQ